MAKGKMELDNRPDTLKENKLVICELRSRNKNDHKSLHEINKLLAKFNAKNVTRFSKNAKASIGTKQEKLTDNPYGHLDGFPPGTWWGIRMDCSRDLVHRPFDKDIQEGPFGAVSICTSRLNTNNDIDLGDYLTITSKDYVSDVQMTHPLLKNYQNQLPLRLIRGYNLTNDYAPKTGYRYDGLYAVVACWIGVTSTTEKHFKYALAKLPHQDSPACRLSRETSGARIKNVQHTRSSVDRLATSIPDDSRNSSVNDDETTRNVRSRSLTTRCALKKFNISSNDSDIVTRCISKKTEGQFCSGMVSVPYAEASSSCSNNRLRDDNSSNSSICKLQNTNISIRTDLYDSSNSTKQETRKITPMTFCRTYKNSRLTGRTMANHSSNVVSLNLNSCGPCPRDNAQESLIQSRSGIVKFSSGQSPSLDPVIDRSTPKSSSIINTDRGTNFYDKRANMSPSVNETIREMPVANFIDVSQRDIHEELNYTEKRMEKMPDSGEKALTDINDEEPRDNERVRINDEIKSSDSLGIMSSSGDETTEDESTRKSLTDLDSLTPDQMLNLIVKQKYNPTAKLLIGSVIGLATGESTILRAYESLMSRKNPSNRDATLRNETNETNSFRENVENSSIVESRDCDSEKKSINERKVAKILPNKRILRDSKDRPMRKMKLGRTRVSKRLLGTEKKSNSNNVRPSNAKRLRKSNITDVKTQQQQFSKSTILKKSKKSAKKRRGELANLVIDANIGPIIRGPRNRRLRCSTHIFAKKRHGNNDIVPSCCAVKNTEVTRGGKKSISRIELSARKSKVSIVKSQISESHYAVSGKILRENVRNYHRERGIKIHETDVNDREKNCSKNRRSNKIEKRKLSRSRSREQLSKISRKISRNDSGNSSDIPGTEMIDATTQCSISRKDATTSTEREIFEISGNSNPLNSIKIEWIDVDDVKSEIYDNDDESEQSSIQENNERVQDFFDDELVSTNQRATAIATRAPESRATIAQGFSAFVPVNMSDGDSRISRLRSIGFKPIQSADISHGERKRSGLCEDNIPCTSDERSYEKTAVTCRKVDELYNKYTSEETTIVGYMDQNLRYQDIEDEASNLVRKNRNIYVSGKSDERVAKLRNEKIDKIENTRDRRVSLSEEDSEVPWHGWKKFVKNKQAQWIGW